MHDLKMLSQIKLGKKIKYYVRKFQQFQVDCKNTWKHINNSIPPNGINKINIIIKITENDITYETTRETNVLDSDLVFVF